MLDLEICKRLEKAGFPLSAAREMRIGHNTDFPLLNDSQKVGVRLAMREMRIGHNTDFPCPNSDELLAEIVEFGYGVTLQNDAVGLWDAIGMRWCEAELRWLSEDEIKAENRPDPNTALAELWLALKEAHDGEN